MRVAQVCPRYYPNIGGVETHVEEISERLAKRGFELEVLTTDPTGKLAKEETINGVKVHRFKSYAPGEAYYFSVGLKDYLKRNSDSYDVVHAHSYHAFPSVYAAQNKNRDRLVFTPHYHGTGHTLFRRLLHAPYRFVGGKSFEKADRVICVSNYERGLVIDRFNIDERKVVLIPNGVNSQEFEGLRKHEKNYKTILYVGRLEKYKGVQYVLKALQMMNEDTLVDVVGKGPYKASLAKLARKLGVEEKVRFFQDLPRGELLQKYADSDVFVQLSKHEAWGISVAEALCAKTPCVVAKTSALIEWVDNKNCFGVNYPIDVNELTGLINSAIKTRGKGLTLMDWDEAVRRTAHLYEELVSNDITYTLSDRQTDFCLDED